MAERRLVSVLFADLVGFTSLSESRDAEEVRELLSARTLLEQATWLASRGRGDEAAGALAEARAVFDALGAAPWVTRAEAVREALPTTPAA